MTALDHRGFVASMLGSLHCAGMCGAFVAFAVGGLEASKSTRCAPARRVQRRPAGDLRPLGVVAGSIGALLNLGGALAGLSRVATVLAGALMIGFGVVALMHAAGKSSMRWPVPPFMQRAMIAGQPLRYDADPHPPGPGDRAADDALAVRLAVCLRHHRRRDREPAVGRRHDGRVLAGHATGDGLAGRMRAAAHRALGCSAADDPPPPSSSPSGSGP